MKHPDNAKGCLERFDRIEEEPKWDGDVSQLRRSIADGQMVHLELSQSTCVWGLKFDGQRGRSIHHPLVSGLQIP